MLAGCAKLECARRTELMVPGARAYILTLYSFHSRKSENLPFSRGWEKDLLVVDDTLSPLATAVRQNTTRLLVSRTPEWGALKTWKGPTSGMMGGQGGKALYMGFCDLRYRLLY